MQFLTSIHFFLWWGSGGLSITFSYYEEVIAVTQSYLNDKRVLGNSMEIVDGSF